MDEVKKKNKTKIIAIILALVLVVGIAVGVFIALRNKRYDKSPYLASICRNRVLNAQYVPDINKIANVSTGLANRGASSNNFPFYLEDVEMDITLENFNGVIEQIGGIDNPFDRDFTINDVKEEVYTVLKQASVFDTWVSFGTEELGGTGLYHFSYDEENGHISIIRRSGFQPWVYDSELGKVIENDDFDYDKPNYPILSEETYKIDYYYNEDGVEVVECEIVGMLNYYEDVMPIKYQYIKNVKDTSFTKYVVAPIISLTDISTEDGGDWGYDIDTQNELGSYRQFIQMDYKNKDDITLLFATQTFSTAHNSIYNSSAINFYRKFDNELYLYNSGYTYGGAYNPLIDLYFNATTGIGFDSIFELYLMHGNIGAGGVTGTPDMSYKTRSTSNITDLDRELYYKNDTVSLYNSPGSYYIKKDEDDANAYMKLETLPLQINQSLMSLARNTLMTEPSVNANLVQSPLYLELSNNESTFKYELFVDKFLKDITQNIVNTSYIKNNYDEIKNAQSKVYIEDEDIVSIMTDYVELKDYTSSASISGAELTYSASASISQSILLNKKTNYSLALVAKGNGNNAKVLQVGESVKFKEEDFSISISSTFDLNSSNIVIEDEYTLCIALVFDDKNIVCSELKPLVFNNEIACELNVYSAGGFSTTYEVSYNDNNMIIATDVKDIQKPVVENNTVTLSTGDNLLDFITKLKISDNDRIAALLILKDGDLFYDCLSQLSSGTLTVRVYDISGNYIDKEVSVVID